MVLLLINTTIYAQELMSKQGDWVKPNFPVIFNQNNLGVYDFSIADQQGQRFKSTYFPNTPFYVSGRARIIVTFKLYGSSGLIQETRRYIYNFE